MPERVEDALQALLDCAQPLGVEWVATAEAEGRVSAEQVRAARQAPGFARAAMDGYVCHDADVQEACPDSPVRLLVTGECRVGKPPAAGPRRGEAWVISTGAAMPLRGDRVLPVERVRREGAVVVVTEPPPRKRHVIQPDEELSEGTVLLEAGDVVRAGTLAALVAGGVVGIRVYRKPRVVLFCTGDELVEPPEQPGAGRVLNTNAFVLTAELQKAGCEVTYGGTLPDRPEAQRAAFQQALSGPYDVVVTTGGVSVGRYDRVPRVWLDLGAERVAGRVDLKPGGPFFAGRVGRRWAVGLSGSPSACLAAYHLLVRPLLLRLGGRRRVVRPVVTVTLHGELAATDRMRAVWAKVSPDQQGIQAQPLAGSVLAAVAGADALLLLREGTPFLRSGSQVPALLLHHPETCTSLTVPPARPAPLVVGVVGVSGSGKTALVEGLVRRLRDAGLQVGVVKHAAHGFQLDREGTDSDRAARAGAVAVVLVGDGEVALRAFPPEAGTVEQAVGLCCGGVPGRVPDVVLVEGFRHPPQRTVVVGTTKEPQGERPWCHLPAWGEIPPASREALLDDLGARLARLAREGQ